MNLAALEVVDYVVIDDNETPIENIKYLQPDFFAKATSTGATGCTRDAGGAGRARELRGRAALHARDVVYSSSAILESAPPDLAVAKLHSLMQGEQLSFEKLREALTALEAFVSTWSATRSSTPTPTALRSGPARRRPRSASSTNGTPTSWAAPGSWRNTSGRPAPRFGSPPSWATTSSGRRAERPRSERGLVRGPHRSDAPDDTEERLHCGWISAPEGRPPRQPSDPEQVLKEFTEAISGTETDVVVFSDFRHGIFNPGTIPELVASLPRRALRVADSQMASRWGNILDFQGFDLITPNEREARFALGDQDSTVRPMALELYAVPRAST